MQEQLDLKDIQGILIRGYSDLKAAQFLLLAIRDAAMAKKWLSLISKGITPGDQRHATEAIHIAFTFKGLKALDLDQPVLNSFPIEMQDGMTTAHKQFFLGDFGRSSPDQWGWGGDKTEEVHILLMLYATNTAALTTLLMRQREGFSGYGLQEIKALGTTELHERKEHFGFHDGISQPTIKGLRRSDKDENCIEPGEFILGYENEYGQYTPRPAAPGLDLGMNGSYLVFRQYRQDVPLFWKYMAEATRSVDGSWNEKEMVKLASQMVGRWPDGTPLVLSPEEPSKHLDDNNAFDYRRADPEGLKCPFAAHIRRSNPKDSLDTDRATSIVISKRHRILRRGRSYGPPLTQELKPLDCLNAAKNDAERGLHFISINADIGRQFEFLQNGWINNHKFNGLYEERDPLIANHHNPQDERTTGTFCIQHNGLRTRLTDLPEFVKIIGGAYFFIPGIRALQFLANT